MTTHAVVSDSRCIGRFKGKKKKVVSLQDINPAVVLTTF
jgi:hypothetical protein